MFRFGKRARTCGEHAAGERESMTRQCFGRSSGSQVSSFTGSSSDNLFMYKESHVHTIDQDCNGLGCTYRSIPSTMSVIGHSALERRRHASNSYSNSCMLDGIGCFKQFSGSKRDRSSITSDLFYTSFINLRIVSACEIRTLCFRDKQYMSHQHA